MKEEEMDLVVIEWKRVYGGIGWLPGIVRACLTKERETWLICREFCMPSYLQT